MKEENFNEFNLKPKKLTKEHKKIIAVLLVILLVLFIFDPGFIIIVILVLLASPILILMNFLAKKRIKHQKLNPDDFGKNKDYYRDIIKGYSPMTLGFIDDFKIEKKEVVGTLLKLKMTDHIKINDSMEIEILKNDTDGLSITEKYIMEKILKGEELGNLTRMTGEEAEMLGLVEKTHYDKVRTIQKMALLSFYSGIIFFIFVFIASVTTVFEKYKFLASIFGLIVAYPYFRIPYLIMYLIHLFRNPWIRTEKGEEINIKLEGLKNYIKDFSMLNEKELKELKLWDDYLIYSVLFGQNKNIVRDLGKNLKIKEINIENKDRNNI